MDRRTYLGRFAAALVEQGMLWDDAYEIAVWEDVTDTPEADADALMESERLRRLGMEG